MCFECLFLFVQRKIRFSNEWFCFLNEWFSSHAEDSFLSRWWFRPASESTTMMTIICDGSCNCNFCPVLTIRARYFNDCAFMIWRRARLQRAWNQMSLNSSSEWTGVLLSESMTIAWYVAAPFSSCKCGFDPVFDSCFVAWPCTGIECPMIAWTHWWSLLTETALFVHESMLRATNRSW